MCNLNAIKSMDEKWSSIFYDFISYKNRNLEFSHSSSTFSIEISTTGVNEVLPFLMSKRLSGLRLGEKQNRMSSGIFQNKIYRKVIW